MGHQIPPNQPFERLSIGKCYAQTANERFGNGARQAVICRERAEYGQSIGVEEQPFPWPGEDLDDDNDAHQSIYRKVPSMQRFRGNLTALSQKYNLYFVAYQRHIFVYRPRNIPAQALPRVPDLQLAPKPSAAGDEIGGYIDRLGPQLINHLITGFLGREEIVLSCFDNGDVIAYYVKDLVRCTSADTHSSKVPQTKEQPTPFFHENVGMTAWGLAIHQKSRLIAVTTNRHEVTVFAFGLQKPKFHNCLVPLPETSGHRPSWPPATLLRRDRNWRIVVLLGTGCENIPNVCFVDDADGEAEKVCAVDVKGFAWLADIWKACQPCTRIEPLPKAFVQSEESYPDRSRGWGILALPESSFMKVKERDELLGMPVTDCYIMRTPGVPGRIVANTIQCLNRVPGNPHPLPNAAPPNVPVLTLNQPNQVHPNDPFQEAMDPDDDIEPPEDEPDEESSDEIQIDSEDDVSSDSSIRETRRPDWREWKLALDDWYRLLDVESHGSSPDHLDMVYYPHSGLVNELPRDHRGLMKFLTRPMEANETPENDIEGLRKLGSKLHLLRTYEKDIELYNCIWPGNPKGREFGVLCGQALLSGRIHPSIRHHFAATSRLNMIAHMPEISAVAVGSAIGRVILLTLTRKPMYPENCKIGFEHAFRVDWILPTLEQEQELRKTLRPLHGMAVGPIYDNVKDAGNRARLPRRYRLMLHYRTHDILSYEITRDEETGKLCIF